MREEIKVDSGTCRGSGGYNLVYKGRVYGGLKEGSGEMGDNWQVVWKLGCPFKVEGCAYGSVRDKYY